MAIKTIILDPGHGGKDPGASGNGIQEKDIVLQIALATKSYLDKNYKDIKVELTRTTDVFIELQDRSAKANILKASLFCSIHINASASAVASGFETFIYNKTSSQATRDLQVALHDSILKEAPYFKDRGRNAADFSVLRNTAMCAVLTESGFITNSTDAAVLKQSVKIDAIARGHALGIAKFLKLQKKTPTVTTTTTYKVGKTFDNKKDAESYIASMEREGHKGFSVYTEKS